MKKKERFFAPYKKHGLEGYYIQVRNSFNNQLEQEFIPEEARDIYKSAFGEKIISDQEFLNWYTSNAEKFR